MTLYSLTFLFCSNHHHGVRLQSRREGQNQICVKSTQFVNWKLFSVCCDTDTVERIKCQESPYSITIQLKCVSYASKISLGQRRNWVTDLLHVYVGLQEPLQRADWLLITSTLIPWIPGYLLFYSVLLTDWDRPDMFLNPDLWLADCSLPRLSSCEIWHHRLIVTALKYDQHVRLTVWRHVAATVTITWPPTIYTPKVC